MSTETKEQRISYVLPQIPLSDTDKVNRKAAATGSINYAMLTADADYNGHPISVTYKPHSVHSACWNAEYYWGERVILGRGDFKRCLEAALNEYRRGKRGASVTVDLTKADPRTALTEQIQLCEASSFIRVPDGVSPWGYSASLSTAALAKLEGKV